MKNVLKGVLTLLIVTLIFIIEKDMVYALNFETKNENLEIYQVKKEEEIILTSKNVLDIYELEVFKIEEQEKIEEEQEEEIVEEVIYDLSSDIVNFALQFVGNPYVMGGISLTNGADCSGFVQTVYANFGIYLPRTTSEQSVSGYGVSIEEIKVGDIVSYGYDGYVTHSAIYIGNNTILHASTPELGIRTDNMYIMPIVAIRRVI